MIFGADYYPEHWNKSEWKQQARLMRECGFNTVRIGEFAWKIFERNEGSFDFSLFDEAIEILAAEGISVIMGTPTAAPPKWLVNKYDVLQRDKFKNTEEWGSRRECCANKSDYIEKSKIIVEQLARHYADNKNVIAWQIDNEFGCHESTICYCEECRRKFARWLEKKYGTIENLNKRWGTVFWSLDFDSFDDIITPAHNACEPACGSAWSHNPALDLEYRRFSSDSWVEYQQIQADIIRRYTDAPITHNFMGHFSDIDYYDLAEGLDFVSWDNYPDNQWGSSEYEYVSMAHENMRGVKNKNFIVMEEQAGPAGWDIVGSTPRPGQLRLWAYQAAAHGAEGMVYFRFRTALFGMEQYWYGVLDHDGVPRRRFYEIQKTGQEFKKLEKYIVGAENEYDALIVKSYDNVWAHAIKRHASKYDYRNHLYSFYKANSDLNVNTAVSRGNYEKYKAVYMIAYNVVREDELDDIKKYVENGGVLVLTFRSGTRDEDNNMRAAAVPGVFAELAGIEAEEFDAPRRPVSICGAFEGTAEIWCDIITPKTAEVLCSYGSEYYMGRAAVTVNRYGKGRVYYVGCDLDDNAASALVRLVCKDAGIETVSAPEDVEIVRRKDCFIVLNHNETAQTVPIKGMSLISDKEFDGTLEPYGVEFIKR